jgi:hypothetical protein
VNLLAKIKKMHNKEENFRNIVKNLRINNSPDTAFRERLRAKVLADYDTGSRGSPHISSQWKLSSLTRYAAVLLIVAGLFSLFTMFIPGDSSSGLALADISDMLLSARTVTYTITVYYGDQSPQSFRGMFIDSGFLRQQLPGRGIMIKNVNTGSGINLFPQQKLAVKIESNQAADNQNRPDQLSFFDIRQMLAQAKQNPANQLEYVGKTRIDNHTALGYRLTDRAADITVWADQNTLQPIRIESYLGQMVGKPAAVVIDNIVFDQQLDQSLFSLEVPKGYNTRKVEVELGRPEEKDLIESLRLWAQLSGGKFPQKLTLQAMQDLPTVVSVRQAVMDRLSDGKLHYAETQDDAGRLIAKLYRGIVFAHSLTEQSRWYYAGADVEFGDRNSVIFRYKDPNSDSWRVIYGDLHAENIGLNAGGVFYDCSYWLD